MKKNFVRKLTASVLCAALVGSIAGCSGLSAESASGSKSKTSDEAESDRPLNPEGTKVGVLCSPLSWGEENYRMVEKCIEKFGEDRIEVTTLPEDADAQTIVSQATTLASETEIGAIVINEAVPGSIAAADAAKAVNSELLVIMVNPSEDPPEVSKSADLGVMTVFEELTIAAAEQAAEKNCEVLVLEVPVDQQGMERAQMRINACQDKCDELGIKLVTNSLPSESDANTRPQMIQAAKEDIYNKLDEYGNNVGFMSFSSFCATAIFTALCEEGRGYIVGTPDPGPFGPGFMDAFNITADADHILDMDWTNKAIADALAEKNMTGHFCNWEIPYFSTMMYGSIAYAIAYLDGEEDTVDIDTWMKYAKESFDLDDTQVEYFPYEKEGTTYDNFAMVNSPFKWYGEEIGVE
jgi:ABC-type sugar transport system substrate-binding protein